MKLFPIKPSFYTRPVTTFDKNKLCDCLAISDVEIFFMNWIVIHTEAFIDNELFIVREFCSLNTLFTRYVSATIMKRIFKTNIYQN